MADKKSTTKSAVDEAAVETSMAADADTVEKGKDEDKEVVKTIKEKKKEIKPEPLVDSDEIAVVSLIPNVSYKDSKTGDTYKWDKVGHVEDMTFETLKNMWKNHKGYFRNMWLKPNDDRVINKFGLIKTFEKYEFLMDEKNYTKKNIDSICESISNTPNGLKIAICNKIKDLVINEKVTDVNVIKKLEKHLNLDLIDFL